MRPSPILFIDDNAALASAYQQSLGELGYRVLTAASGDEALEVCTREVEARLAIVDLKLPGMDGPQVIAALRERCPHLQVIVVSAQPLQPYFMRLSELGVRMFLPKPFSIDMLLASIREMEAA